MCNVKRYRAVASFNVTPCTSYLLPNFRSFVVTLDIAHLWKIMSLFPSSNETRPSVTLIVGSNARTYKQILINQTYSFYDKISYKSINWDTLKLLHWTYLASHISHRYFKGPVLCYSKRVHQTVSINYVVE